MPVREPHRVAVLVWPDVLALEFGIAAQIFGTDPHYRLQACAAGSSAAASTRGWAITAEAGPEAIGRAQTVVVPGYAQVDAEIDAAVLDALRDAHAAGARIVSICSGAFALGAAGLLDGRPCTTHWQQCEELARRHPRAEVLANRLFVDAGDILTSAGVTAGVDLCLHLIRRDHGPAAATSRARAIVAAPQRLGNQGQFIESLPGTPSDQPLAELCAWILDHLAEDHDVDALARRAHMSRRTLVRRFRAETGTSPMAWLTDARLQRAREILERSDEPIEQLGRVTGMGSPASVRAHFHRRLGLSPQDYRAQFRTA